MKCLHSKLCWILAMISGILLAATAQAAPNQWNGSGPLATGLGNRVISAMTVSADGKTVYAGTASGTVFSYDVPPALSAVGVSGITQAAALLTATSDKNATGYWIVVARDASAPNSTEVRAGVSYGGVAVAAAGSGAMSVAVAASFAVGRLSAGTDYDLYVIAEDANGNQTVPPSKAQFNTLLDTYTIGGVVSGLAAGQSVVLQNNGGDDLGVHASRAFVFSASIAHGASYAVTVLTQPVGQTCTVANGSGTATANVSGVGVVCTTHTYTIGGTVSGLAVGQSVVLQNNGGNNLTVNASGAFTFGTPIAHGAAYAVTVSTQPAGQTCTVAHGIGTATANVSNVAVTCSANTYTIGGTVSGLAVGQSVVLQNNGGNNLTVNVSGPFTFGTPIAHGGGYAVTVSTQPAGQTCTVAHGSGTATANVSNVAVTCSANTYTIGGTVAGLAAGQSVVLQNNGGNNLTVNVSGAFTFGTPIAQGAAYAVTVLTQPSGQICTVANGTGTATANVSNVSVGCAAATYAIATAANPPAGGTVSCTPNPVANGASATCAATPNAGYTLSDWGGDCAGASCTLANVTSAKSVTANFTLLGTKTYTGPSATGSGNTTASFTGGGAACGYTVSRFIAVAMVSVASPAGVNFPHGLFDFTAGGCTPGSTLSFTITYPQALAPNTQYWKFGPTPDNAAPHWYVLPATIVGNTASFSITDGGLGDDDLAVNGVIVDQGGPGAGNPQAVPTLSRGALAVLVALLVVLGGIARRRRR